MPRNFYFGKNADIVSGSANFAAKIAVAPTSLGLTAAQSTYFGTLNTALQTAAAAASNPDTRTSVAIAARNTAIRNMRANAVNLAKIIYSTATVTNAQLIELGLLPRNNYTPIPPITSSPSVEIVSNTGRIVKVRVHNPEAETSRGKPRGCIGIGFYTYIGAVAPTDSTQYFFQGMSTRTITDIQFANSVASGATVWICACWVMSRGWTGPASTPFSFTIQGGPIAAAA